MKLQDLKLGTIRSVPIVILPTTKVLTAALCAAVLLLGYSSNAVADNSGNAVADNTGAVASLRKCVGIEDNAKRLACYDQLAGSISRQQADGSVESQSNQQPEQVEAFHDSGTEIGQKYLRKPQDSTKPTSVEFDLIAAYKDRKKRWVFEFENGQIWQQLEAGYLPKPKHLPTDATLSKGVFGTHNLRVGYIGKTVKVKRLR